MGLSPYVSLNREIEGGINPQKIQLELGVVKSASCKSRCNILG
jgi:hypothetical protein